MTRPPVFPTLPPAQARLLRSRLRLSIRDAGLTDLTPMSVDQSSGQPAPPFWELEPSAVVLGAGEWALLEDALKQRAHFVNAMLVDLYAGRAALRNNLLPPEVILGDPYYRRPCIGLEPNRASPATVLRFNLVKTAAGWHFTDTRANTPAGFGYAVQNRRFLTQEATDLYHALPDYQSVVNFPLQLLDALHGLAPDTAHSPSIVVLTAGPQDPFYSEHSFLARKMGLPLARGDDLIVLDNRVWFKTIGGLEPVDILYRRLNDAHIDPVVFSTDRETAGIPGLLQCIRGGTVALANAIGTGVAESRSLDPYLGKLMRFYLGEKPLLPSLPTYSCGDNDQLDYILENGSKLQMLPAHDPRIGDPRLRAPAPVLLDENGLAAIVRQNPFAYIARESVEPLTLVADDRKSPPFRLAAFVLCSGRHFSVFPGGLVLVGADDPPIDRVGNTADAVVLAGTPNDAGGVADIEATVSSGITSHNLGSRAAESLFWLGRYLERAESTARMLSLIDDVALEEIPARDRRRWLPLWRGLLEATGHNSEEIPRGCSAASALPADLMWRMALDPHNPSSIHSSVRAAGENTRQLRDHVSPEAWVPLGRLLTRLESLYRQRPSTPARGAPPPTAALQIVLVDVNAFLGVAERTMLHDAGWHFLRLGLHLERATMTCGALRHILAALDTDADDEPTQFPRDTPELSALLRMLGSQDAYRRLFQTRSEPRLVAALFLQRVEAPRSVFHNLSEIKAGLRAIRLDTDEPDDDPATKALNETLEFLTSLKLGRHFGAEPGENGESVPKLSDLLTQLVERVQALHPLLSDHYFSHQARLQSKR